MTIRPAAWSTVPIGLALLVNLSACDDKPTPTAGSATATAATSAAPKPSASAKALPPPAALDVAKLKASLKCGKGGHGPCEVLQEFEDCRAFDPVTQSGDGRWLGQGSIVKKGAFVDELTLLRSRRVPLSEVGPGQLPAKIASGVIPNDRVAERRHAEAAIRAMRRGDVAKQTNAAMDYIKQRDDWQEAFSMKAADNQVYVAAAGGGYLCAKDKQRLLFVSLSGDREHPADGVYAEMWPVTW
jgi:hypothetical protein